MLKFMLIIKLNMHVIQVGYFSVHVCMCILFLQCSSTMDSKPRRLPFTVSSSSSLSPSSFSSSALSAGRLYGRGSVLGSERFSRGAVGKLDSDYQVKNPDADPQVNRFSRVPVGQSTVM